MINLGPVKQVGKHLTVDITPLTVSKLKVSVEREGLFLLGSHDARLLILANAFLEEVRLSLQTEK